MGELRFNAPCLVRHGYDTRQVNAFMRRIDDTLRGGTAAPVTARDLVTAKFRRVMPFARGYACPDVDAFLFDVAPSVIRANSARMTVSVPGTDPGIGAARPRQAQQPGRHWLGRLVHRPD